MSILEINYWHWQMIKILVKYSLRYHSEEPLIHRGMIEELSKHPQEIKELIRIGEKAYENLRMAERQFNYISDENQVDAIIYQMIKWEREIARAEKLTEKELEKIFRDQTSSVYS